MKKLISSLCLLSLSLSPLAHGDVVTIYPASFSGTNGSVSTVPISALSIQDQSGSQNDWDKYLEFSPGNVSSTIFNFNLPSSINTADIISYKVNTNYLGQAKEFQLWSFKLKNQVSALYTTLGSTKSAIGWQWSPMSFTLNADKSYVSSGRIINLEYSSNNSYDASDLDFLSITVTTKPPVVVTPTPMPVPTIPPTTTWWKPAVGTKWAIQFSGLPLAVVGEAAAQNVDLFDTAQADINKLHANGKKVICYFSAGSFEDWRSDAGAFPTAVLGNSLSGWAGERWLDIKKIDLLKPIMLARLNLAVAKKCDGIDIDNVDGYTQVSGFTISYQDQIAYNKMLANESHARGLGIGLKNDLNQIKDLVDSFDWVINEQCFQYNECHLLTPFITKNKPVFTIEYSGQASNFCPKANKLKFSTIKKKLNLNSYVDTCSNYGTAL
ncbi:MAG: endo alpha-1,4 polygalactosaminidase [Bacteriovoracaceae bacterium]